MISPRRDASALCRASLPPGPQDFSGPRSVEYEPRPRFGDFGRACDLGTSACLLAATPGERPGRAKNLDAGPRCRCEFKFFDEAIRPGCKLDVGKHDVAVNDAQGFGLA